MGQQQQTGLINSSITYLPYAALMQQQLMTAAQQRQQQTYSPNLVPTVPIPKTIEKTPQNGILF